MIKSLIVSALFLSGVAQADVFHLRVGENASLRRGDTAVVEDFRGNQSYVSCERGNGPGPNPGPQPRPGWQCWIHSDKTGQTYYGRGYSENEAKSQAYSACGMPCQKYSHQVGCNRI